MLNDHGINSLIEKALPLLRCPRCQHDSLVPKINGRIYAVACSGCHFLYPVVDGVIDFFPDYKPGKSMSQFVMENKHVASIYEDYFRPAFTWFGSPVSYEEEEAWLGSRCTLDPVRYVLDLASGTGRYARYLAGRYKPDLVIAIDLSMPMLEKGFRVSLAKGLDNILFIKGDAQCIPVKDGSIEHLNCFGALHLFPDAVAAMQELSRVGSNKALFTCLTACKLNGIVSSSFQKIFSNLASFNFFDIDELKDQLHGLNFHDFEHLQRKMLLMFSARLHKKQFF